MNDARDRYSTNQESFEVMLVPDECTMVAPIRMLVPDGRAHQPEPVGKVAERGSD